MSFELTNHIAVIIDGRVEQMMLLDDRFAAILLSDPIFIDVTGQDGKPMAFHGWSYNEETNEFIRPENWVHPDDLVSLDQGIPDNSDIIQ